MSATKQLTETTSQVWGAKQNLIMPEPQFLPEGVEPISGTFTVTESLPSVSVVQSQSSNIWIAQEATDFFQTASMAIGTFMTGITKGFITTKRLDRDIVSQSVYCITLDRIVVDGKTLRLNETITANVTYKDSMYFCQNENLGIVSMSARLEDCIRDFQDEVSFVWNEYGREDDTRLTNDARELKRRILRYISK
jgi:hypothetical protein